MNKHYYGWIPSVPDKRDEKFRFSLFAGEVQQLPPMVDLRPVMPVVYDQGQLGSCTANAIGAAIEYEIMRQKLADFIPSRLFIYYNERDMENTVPYDAGAQIRDGIKSVYKQGVCPENEWAYDITKFTVKPPQQCYTDALKSIISQYTPITQDANSIKGSLAKRFPVIAGITIYDSFEYPETGTSGIVPMPDFNNESVQGGHAVLCVGYDDTKQVWIMRNSWGVSWGQNGYFTLPYAYLTDADLASDFWAINLVQ